MKYFIFNSEADFNIWNNTVNFYFGYPNEQIKTYTAFKCLKSDLTDKVLVIINNIKENNSLSIYFNEGLSYNFISGLTEITKKESLILGFLKEGEKLINKN